MAFPLSCSVTVGKLSAVLNSCLKQSQEVLHMDSNGMSAYSLPPSKKLYLLIFLVFLTAIEYIRLVKG